MVKLIFILIFAILFTLIGSLISVINIDLFVPENQANLPFNRSEKMSFKDDTTKPFSIGIKDIDESIMYYFNNVIKPSTIIDGNRINVPIMYGAPERWKSVQKDGYFRDKEGQDVLFFVDNIFRFTQAGSEVSALLGRIPSAVGYQPTLATDMGNLQERITTTNKGSITSVQAIYVPADDLTDPAPAGSCPGSMEIVFELANAYRSFGAVKALEDINLSVAKGERVAFIGASGSGKTTLLRLLGAQLAPDRGSVQVLGRERRGHQQSAVRRARLRVAQLAPHERWRHARLDERR